MYWPTLPSNGGEQDFIGIFTGNSGTGTGICYASIGNNAGQMYWSLYNNVVGADHTSSATINAGVWYQVQMAGYVSSTVGFMTLWVNGNLIMNITKQNLGSTNVGTVQLTTDSVTVGQYWDDITVATSYITSAGNTGAAEYVDNAVAATSYADPATSSPMCSVLSASPGGSSPYSYQWYLNNAAVSGATSASWTFTPSSTGTYGVTVRITDQAGNQVTSNRATVTVRRASASVAATNATPSQAVIVAGEINNSNETLANDRN
jgi:hypothetical protein